MRDGKPDTIVFIHGLYLNGRAWAPWAKRYESRGYRVLAPSWPGLDGEVETLRRDPSPIARQDVRAILAHYDGIIRALPRPPIIIGHSFGGAFTQILLDRGLGAAGVVLESGTIRGVYDLPLSTLRATWPLLRNPFARHVALMPTPAQFRYAFTNTFTPDDARRAYEQWAIPASRNVLLAAAFTNLNPGTALRVNYRNDARAPLLFIAGGADNIVPASVNRHNARRYAGSKAVTDFREYPGRAHFTMAQQGWEQVADDALDWAERHARGSN